MKGHASDTLSKYRAAENIAAVLRPMGNTTGGGIRLLGWPSYCVHRFVPLSSMVANINIDRVEPTQGERPQRVLDDFSMFLPPHSPATVQVPKELINWVLGEERQHIVAEVGYILMPDFSMIHTPCS